MFLAKLNETISKQDDQELDRLIEAIHIAKVNYHINYDILHYDTISFNDGKMKLYEYLFKNNHVALTQLILILKGSNSLIPAFHYFIKLNNLAMVKFFIEDAEVPLIVPSADNELNIERENPLFLANEDLDIFKYLLPIYVNAYQELSQVPNMKMPSDLIASLIQSLSKCPGEKTKRLNILQCYQSLEKVFNDYTKLNLFKGLTDSYKIDKAYSLTLLSYFLATIAEDENQLKNVGKQQFQYYRKLIKMLFNFISQDKSSEQEQLMTIYKNEILPRYLAILSYYGFANNQNPEYISAWDFLTKNKLAEAFQYMNRAKKTIINPTVDLINNNNHSNDLITDVNNNIVTAAKIAPLDIKVLPNLVLLLIDKRRDDEVSRLLIDLAIQDPNFVHNLMPSVDAYPPLIQFNIHLKLGQIFQQGSDSCKINFHHAAYNLDRAINIYKVNSEIIDKANNNNNFNDLYDGAFTVLAKQPYYTNCLLISLWNKLINHIIKIDNLDKFFELINLGKENIKYFDQVLQNLIIENMYDLAKEKEKYRLLNFITMVGTCINENIIDPAWVTDNPTPMMKQKRLSLYQYFDLADESSFDEIKQIVNAQVVPVYELATNTFSKYLIKSDSNQYSQAKRNYIKLLGFGARNGCLLSLNTLHEMYIYITINKERDREINNALAEQYSLNITINNERDREINNALAEQYSQLITSNRFPSLKNDFQTRKNVLLDTKKYKIDELRSLIKTLNNWMAQVSANYKIKFCDQPRTLFFNNNELKKLPPDILDGVDFAKRLILSITDYVDYGLTSNNCPRQIMTLDQIYYTIQEYLLLQDTNITNQPPTILKLCAALRSLEYLREVDGLNNTPRVHSFNK